MDKKLLFNETLASLVEFAQSKGNQLTMDDVHFYFKDQIEDESQYQFIYDYLTINKIQVDGYTLGSDNIFIEETADADTSESVSENTKTSADGSFANTTDLESEEELAFIDMYMKDLEAIPPMDATERDTLLAALLSANMDVVDRLVEGHLATVADIAQNYRGRGVHYGDLIQEGNIGLMLALSEYTEQSGNFTAFITEKINTALEETVNAQINSDRVGKHLADKLNHLDAVTKNLTEELGRVPEIAELADAMGTNEEEVSMLLKTSLDILSVNEDTQITDASQDVEATPTRLPSDTAGTDPLQWRVPKK